MKTVTIANRRSLLTASVRRAIAVLSFLAVSSFQACGDTHRQVLAKRSFGARALSDGDADNPRDADGDSHDGREDHDDDSRTPASYDYHDADDSEALHFGRAASPNDRQRVAVAVRRYYASAAASDGAAACSLLVPTMAATLAQDYGGASGPAYVRGASSCQAIMTVFFRRAHAGLAGPVSVTGVRVAGSSARAILASPTLPASELSLQRWHGRWWIDQMFSTPLP